MSHCPDETQPALFTAGEIDTYLDAITPERIERLVLVAPVNLTPEFQPSLFNNFNDRRDRGKGE